MKKIMLFLLCLVLLSACSSEVIMESEKSVNVEVQILKLETYPEKLSYTGVVKSSQIKNYAFKSSGYLEQLYVSEFQQVEKGDVLASLDTKDIEFQLAASKNNMDAAYSIYQKALSGTQQEDINTAAINVEKARAVFDYNQENFINLSKLFDEGVISQSALDQAALSLEISDQELQQSIEIYNKAVEGASDEDIQSAYSQYLAARQGYEAYQSLINDATLMSDVSGKVLKILFDESEIVPAGYPVVIVSSHNMTIETSVSQKDIYKISNGMPCEIIIENQRYTGEIQSISQSPNENSLTYPITIQLSSDVTNILNGTIVKIDIILNEIEGIWLDIKNILNDGDDYVYIVEQERALRIPIQIRSINNDKLLIEGLNPEDILIIGGLDVIKNGSKIKIVE
ncbi:MAG: HlyD family efflux transporter periplasmic adaptor subunit [Tissierellales bacterium]|nr:HlyD family efflux transporter periplasmic adaptor subunit [Tissierellales bacterium]MBN2826958.1 HlyD family efflux transporter periplasmic adaptor subunit [Tissierellales bacterium]